MLGERMEDRIYKVYMHINMKNRKIYIGITKRSLKKRFGYNGNGQLGIGNTQNKKSAILTLIQAALFFVHDPR